MAEGARESLFGAQFELSNLYPHSMPFPILRSIFSGAGTASALVPHVGVLEERGGGVYYSQEDEARAPAAMLCAVLGCRAGVLC